MQFIVYFYSAGLQALLAEGNADLINIPVPLKTHQVIYRIALAKQGDNTVGSVRLSMCEHPPAQTVWHMTFIFDIKLARQLSKIKVVWQRSRSNAENCIDTTECQNHASSSKLRSWSRSEVNIKGHCWMSGTQCRRRDFPQVLTIRFRQRKWDF